MPWPIPRRRIPRLARLAAVVALSACGGTVPQPAELAPDPGRTEPLDESAITAVAELLEMEDRDQLRIALVRVHAASADPVVRARAALAVGRIGDGEGAPVLRALLADPDTAVAATAAFAAGLLGDPGLLPDLLTRLAPPRDTLAPTVAAEAAAALGRLGGDEASEVLANYLLGTDTAAVQRNLPVLLAAVPAAVEAGVDDGRAFTRWLGAASPELRRKAIEALVTVGRPGIAPTFVAMANDDEAWVRGAAVGGLARGSQLPPEALPAVLALASDSIASVRVEAAAVVGHHVDQVGAAAALDLLRRDDPQRRAATIEGLRVAERVPPSVAAELSRIAADRAEPSGLRARAIAALAATDLAGASPLIDRLRDDPSWRVRAALAAAASEDMDAARRFMTDTDPRVGRAAIRAALAAPPPDELFRLRPLLIETVQAGDAQLRASALDGLARLADLAIFPFLLDAYAAADDDVEADARLAAIDAIAGLRASGIIAAPERAFFARFDPPQDDRVRNRIYERFREAAERFWGPPLPVESPRQPESYLALAARWIAPADPVHARPRVLVRTDRGDLLVQLYGDLAPLAVANFLALANVGFFQGQEIAALAPGRWLVAGTPDGDIVGGPGYLLRREPSRAPLPAGSLVMADEGNAAHGSRFFITLAPDTEVDGVTAFGRVLEGFETLETLLPGDRILEVLELPTEE